MGFMEGMEIMTYIIPILPFILIGLLVLRSGLPMVASTAVRSQTLPAEVE